jgi:WD40 repeat protein
VKIWSKGKIGDHFALGYTFKQAEGPITAIIASGDAFICGNSKGTLLVWEAVKRRFTYEPRVPIKAHKGKITHIRAAHTGIKDTFFSCSLDKTIKIWSLRKEKLALLQTLDEDFGSITALEIPKGTEEIFAGYSDGKVRRWRNDGPLGYRLISTIQAHHEGVKTLDFSKYASQMVSSDGTEIKLWSSTAEKEHGGFDLRSIYPAAGEDITCVRSFVDERQNAIKHLYCFSENHFTRLTNVQIDGPVLRSKVPIMATNPVQQSVNIPCIPLPPANAGSKQGFSNKADSTHPK